MTRTKPKPATSTKSAAAAKAEAERLLSFQDPPALQTTKPPEPTLYDRLANIDRRAKERAAEEKRLLALDYLKDKEIEFERVIKEHEAVLKVWNELQGIRRLTAGPAGVPTITPAETHRGGRANSALLSDLASKVVQLLMANAEMNVQQLSTELSQPTDIVRATLAKLKREKKIKSNGHRGLNGAWLLA